MEGTYYESRHMIPEQSIISVTQNNKTRVTIAGSLRAISFAVLLSVLISDACLPAARSRAQCRRLLTIDAARASGDCVDGRITRGAASPPAPKPPAPSPPIPPAPAPASPAAGLAAAPPATLPPPPTDGVMGIRRACDCDKSAAPLPLLC